MFGKLYDWIRCVGIVEFITCSFMKMHFSITCCLCVCVLVWTNECTNSLDCEMQKLVQSRRRWASWECCPTLWLFNCVLLLIVLGGCWSLLHANMCMYSGLQLYICAFVCVYVFALLCTNCAALRALLSSCPDQSRYVCGKYRHIKRYLCIIVPSAHDHIAFYSRVVHAQTTQSGCAVAEANPLCCVCVCVCMECVC